MSMAASSAMARKLRRSVRCRCRALGAGDAITTRPAPRRPENHRRCRRRARHEITARFGAAFTTLLEQALGQGDAPISPRKPLPDYIVEKRFAEPVATDAVIAATLSRLAGMLVAAMEQQGKGARRLEADFFRTDGAVRAIAVDTGQPVTRREVIDRLFRERLDALSDPLDPGFGFDLVRLSASRSEIVVQQQRDLDANVHDNDELAALIDRIAARIGGQARRRASAAGHASFRSARCWRCRRSIILPWRAPGGLAGAGGRRAAAAPAAAVRAAGADQGASRRCRTARRPGFIWRRATHAVVRAEGPERIAMEWWRPQAAGADARLFPRRGRGRAALLALSRRALRQRDRQQEGQAGAMPNWFVHGLFA